GQKHTADARPTLADLCYSTSLHRTHHEHRLALVSHSVEELSGQLAAVAAGDLPAGAVTGRVPSGERGKLAFVFCGRGPQWWAMGRQLLAGEPVFRDMIRRCDTLLQQAAREGGHAPWSLWEELHADEERSRLQETSIAQPAIFAVQVALAALWESWGIRPDLVPGHSVGEVAAAYTAGVLSLEDAARVIFHRGRCMDLAPQRGRMLAVGLSLDQARQAIAGREDRVGIAAVNSPTSITLSGDGAALAEVAAELQTKNVFNRFLHVQYAFHSPQMEPVRPERLRALRDVGPGPAALPLVSTVAGELADGRDWGADYWWRNVRQSVRFADAAGVLAEQGAAVVLELSPHPVLGSAIAECFQERGQ